MDLREVYFSLDPAAVEARRLAEARGEAPPFPRSYEEVRLAVFFPEDAEGLVAVLRREGRLDKGR